MRILHTSDWHLGQNFMGKSREEEHSLFLDWLTQTIQTQNIDVLIIAGDIFDTGTPPNYALELYYNFLKQISLCKYIIITAGNHDSIATLKAPKQLLKTLGIYVITSGDKNEDEIIEILNDGVLEGVICGVPFLRDSVVRKSFSGETLGEKEFSLSEGIKEHYNDALLQAKKLLDGKVVPIIATGHLTTVGSKTSESERDIYIGGTLDIDSDFLGKNFDYVALGHLHINQKVGKENVRYSGSPIPLSFSESTSQKKVNIITFVGKELEVQELDIPLFRPLLVIRGDEKSIKNQLKKIEDKNTWIEIHLDDNNPFIANQNIRELAEKLNLSILALKIDKTLQALHSSDIEVLSLDELKPLEVFQKRLEVDAIEDEELKSKLITNFKKIVQEVELL